MRDKIIRIHWHDPLPFDEALQSNLTKTQYFFQITPPV